MDFLIVLKARGEVMFISSRFIIDITLPCFILPTFIKWYGYSRLFLVPLLILSLVG